MEHIDYVDYGSVQATFFSLESFDLDNPNLQTSKNELEQQPVCHNCDLFRQLTYKSKDICCLIATAPAFALLLQK